jgi:hypothetical protein
MFDTSYPYSLKGKQRSKAGELGAVVHLFAFRTPQKRCIIVEIHLFDAQPIAIVKFFDKAHRLSPKRFSLLSSTNEAAPIIRTAVNVMLSFYKDDPYISFAFMGAPDANGNIQKSKRFRVYAGMMKRLFSDLEFRHLQREDRSLYILLNRNYCDNKSDASKDIFDLLSMAYPDEWGTN